MVIHRSIWVRSARASLISKELHHSSCSIGVILTEMVFSFIYLSWQVSAAVAEFVSKFGPSSSLTVESWLGFWRRRGICRGDISCRSGRRSSWCERNRWVNTFHEHSASPHLLSLYPRPASEICSSRAYRYSSFSLGKELISRFETVAICSIWYQWRSTQPNSTPSRRP